MKQNAPTLFLRGERESGQDVRSQNGKLKRIFTSFKKLNLK